MSKRAKMEIVTHFVSKMGFERQRREEDGEEMVHAESGLWTLKSIHETFLDSLDELLDPRTVDDLQGNVLRHTFDVVEQFDSPKGKFPDNLGNVAIADCNYIDDYFSASLHALLQPLREKNANLHLLLQDRESKQSGRLFDVPVLDFCNYAM